MSLKYYGIYLAYPPTVDLCAEGLGRHLASFLKGAAERDDVRFVIVCPTWSKESIYKLCSNEGVPQDSFDLKCAKRPSTFLVLHQRYHDYLTRRKPKKKSKWFQRVVSYGWSIELLLSKRLLQARRYSDLLIILLLLPIIAIKGVFLILSAVKAGFKKNIKRLYSMVIRRCNKPLRFVKEILFNPKNNSHLLDKFKLIEEQEIEYMLEIINDLSHVKAWYAPTAFWPSFNLINAPTLMCVPDVVLTEFPVGFCSVGGQRFLDRFNLVEQTIRGGKHFVTYSEQIKKETLMKRYGLKSKNISVISHAPNRLDHLVKIAGSIDPASASVSYCQQRIFSALKKSSNVDYTSLFKNSEVKFIFYASQFRPSKNIMTLLRAYKFLLQNRFVGHKLILTGSAENNEISDFIFNNNLTKDVLLLHGLSLDELAACYKLADIAVNPSLSEGGCPFTFTEALSVNTPVIMAKIPVTTEIIADENLQDLMLFDPYSWQDLVERLEWAILNRSHLLDVQSKFYHQLNKRTWRHVVDEYIDVLDSISVSGAPITKVSKQMEFS